MNRAPDFLGMDDADFLKQPPAEASGATTEQTASPEKTEKTEETSSEEAVEKVEKTETTEETTSENEGKKPEETEEETDEAKTSAEKTEETQTEKSDANLKSEPDANGKTEDASSKTAEQKEDKSEKPKDASTTSAEPLDYEAAYKKIMAPFKANGRKIELRSPEEAVALMQMGANYTKRMQELAPHRKVLQMLQNNELLDEGKLSFLIDLQNKDPEAIKKLIKDAGMDPMEIDTSVEPEYREGNHRVSDEEVTFHTVLDDMKSTPERLETLTIINNDWDQVSKQALWGNPEIMNVIHGQRESGVYDRIAAEVVRQRTLGQIPPSLPFLQAYKVIGDQMTADGKFADLNQDKTKPAGSKQVVATRVAAPKPAVKNSDKAAAASTHRSPSTKAPTVPENPLAMRDEDFMKQFEGRL